MEETEFDFIVRKTKERIKQFVVCPGFRDKECPNKLCYHSRYHEDHGNCQGYCVARSKNVGACKHISGMRERYGVAA